jgi:hypothetical protein
MYASDLVAKYFSAQSDSRKVLPASDPVWRSSGTAPTTCPVGTCVLPYSVSVVF